MPLCTSFKTIVFRIFAKLKQGIEFGSSKIVIHHFNAVQPVFAMIAIEQNSTVVKLAYRVDMNIFRGIHIVKCTGKL